MSLSALRQLILPTRSTPRYSALGPASPIDTASDNGESSSGRSSTSSSTSLPGSSNLRIEKSSQLNGSTHSSSSPSSQLCRINPRTISDLTIGLSDGLTVPFALTAGLSALGSARLVVYAGFAELIAGSISMGLGGYLGSKSEAEAYQAALSETRKVVYEDADDGRAAEMVREVFADFAILGDGVIESAVASLRRDSEKLTEFLMRFRHQMEGSEFTSSRAYASGLTISAGYFSGGMVPLLPYFFAPRVQEALVASVALMVLALFAFGWAKTALVGECSRVACFKSAVQMVVLGGIAAGAAMGCVKAVGGS
ncbi:DUF125-domain-containing protein [Polychaeton citri CBS 116435]|uniref:DUF125-domain-containing protein n=1 Tax=Polychaeton citri CBS 116435 TaxID=1314669 RepID=A0A9P4QBQ5_9PEZI|nr:DUF125-domain-containing protein [Polychaeton citri CBS 116435]